MIPNAGLERIEPIRPSVGPKCSESQRRALALAWIAECNAEYQKLCESTIKAGPNVATNAEARSAA